MRATKTEIKKLAPALKDKLIHKQEQAMMGGSNVKNFLGFCELYKRSTSPESWKYVGVRARTIRGSPMIPRTNNEFFFFFAGEWGGGIPDKELYKYKCKVTEALKKVDFQRGQTSRTVVGLLKSCMVQVEKHKNPG